jgi:hypothetical protein
MDWLYILLSRLGINVAPTILGNALRMFTIAEKKLQQASSLEEQRIEALTRKVQKLNHIISAAHAGQKDAKDRIDWINKKVAKLREFTL